jgi:hypothetical protein
MEPVSKNISAATGTTAPVRTAKAQEESAPEAQVQDKIEKGESGGFLTKVKDFVAKDMKPADKTYEAYSGGDFFTQHKEKVTGAVVGGVIGGALGGVIAYNSAMSEVRKLPVQEVTLEWDKPVMQDKKIGQMPADYYEPNNVFGWFRENHLVDVVRPAPVIEPATGKPAMQHVEKTWNEHGKPVVRWQEKQIGDPYLRGYHESRWEDSHTETVKVGTDRDGNPIYEERTRIDGWQHRFSADVSEKSVGTYKEPRVEYETGVSVGLRTAIGVLAGVGAGALVGAVAASAVKKALARKEG